MAKSLAEFLRQIEGGLPNDVVRIEKQVSPATYEVTALLQHLENLKRFPALLFEKTLNVKGTPSSFRLVSNLFATRSRCALALGMNPAENELPLSLEYAKREE